MQLSSGFCAVTLNNSGLVWQDMDSMPLYEGYQNKIWGCGRGWSLQPWKQFTLFAEGRVAKGNCGTEFIVTRSERCEDKICVDPQELHIGADGISIMFENEKKDVTVILKCMYQYKTWGPTTIESGPRYIYFLKSFVLPDEIYINRHLGIRLAFVYCLAQ